MFLYIHIETTGIMQIMHVFTFIYGLNSRTDWVLRPWMAKVWEKNISELKTELLETKLIPPPDAGLVRWLVKPQQNKNTTAVKGQMSSS